VLAFDENDAFEDAGVLDWYKFELKGTCGVKSRPVGISIGGRKKAPIKSLLCSREVLNMEDMGSDLIKAGDKKFNNIRTHLDWSLGNDKIECPKDSYVKGIAQNGRNIKGILCAYSSPNSLGTKCVGRGDYKAIQSIGDWQVGYNKISCEKNEYIAGVATKKGNPISILCCN
jgi:hypothetical protein